MSPTVRRAEAGEGELLHELAADTFPLACPAGTDPADIESFIELHLSAERFESYLADPDRILLVVTSLASFVGYTMLVFGAPQDADVAAAVTARPTAELSKCYVSANAHGTGVATELIAATITEARLSGAKSLWLGVNNQNERANRFYEKSGFVTVGTKHFLLGTDWQDDFTRELVL